MAYILKEDFVARLVKGLDMPAKLLDAMTEPCQCGSAQCEGWKVTRMPGLDEIKRYGLEQRFAMSGWRTSLAAIIEE